MRSLVIGFVAGAAVLQHQATLPSAFLLGLLLVFALLACFLLRRRVNRVARIAGFAFAGAMLGFGWAGLFAQHYLARELPRDWEGRDITVVGTIDSLPYHFERGVRFNFAVERVVAGTEPAPALPPKLSLSWYASTPEQETGAGPKVEPGERWQLTVRLRRPHGNANPHGFDYEVWLLERNIRATGYVRPDQRAELKNERLDAFVPSAGNIVERSRGWLRDKILAALPGKEYAGVIVALVVGDQRAISHGD